MVTFLHLFPTEVIF